MEIKIINGTKKFKENIVFEDININFKKGEFYLIKGYNGSGKTVLLKCICGFMMLDAGKVLQNNKQIREKNNYIENAGISIENPQFLSHLTLIENLKLLKKMNSNITDSKIDEWIEFYNIVEFKDTKYKNLSLGTKQKMALIQAFIHKPEVLILDEPFNALDKESLDKTEEYLKNIKNDVIIILTTHIHDSIKYLCDHEYIFENKKLKIK